MYLNCKLNCIESVKLGYSLNPEIAKHAHHMITAEWMFDLCSLHMCTVIYYDLIEFLSI